MYSTAAEYLGLYQKPKSTLVRGSIHLPDGISTGDYGPYRNFVDGYDIYEKPPHDEAKISNEKKFSESFEEKTSTISKNHADPRVWGPPYWYSLHNSSMYYPLEPSALVRETIKGRIKAIPFEIPCNTCRHHATAFIQEYDLDKVVSSREDLIKFYTDFHNQVNRRYGKPTWTYEQVKKHYGA